MKVAFLDRDGTLNKDYIDSDWTNKTEPEILAGTINGLNYLRERGYEFIIITNQYIIGEGFISYLDYKSFNDNLINVLNKEGISILDTFYCPHARGSGCDCHKPSTGMIEQAIRKYPDIDMNNSIFIGDSLSDLKLAEKFGLTFFGLGLECKRRLENLAEIEQFI